jgi:hypothetical protein
MARFTRSARGDVIDFELLSIKASLAAAPAPKSVEQRKKAIDAKDGIKTTVAPDLSDEMLAVSADGARASSVAGKQIKKK